MRLHRFFVDRDFGQSTSIRIEDEELVHQIRKVFRLKDGDDVIVFNGTGFDYECKIDSANRKSTIVSDKSIINLLVTTMRRSRFVPSRKIFLCAAVVKKDTFEWITEKATEIGVTDVIPVISHRTEKKSLNENRLRKIAVEASEQSGRGDIPMIHETMGVFEAVERLEKEGTKILVFHTEGESFDKKGFTKNNPSNSDAMAVFTGPEGGWSEDEIDMFHARGLDIYCLGSQILRAETAAVATLSMVVFG